MVYKDFFKKSKENFNELVKSNKELHDGVKEFSKKLSHGKANMGKK